MRVTYLLAKQVRAQNIRTETKLEELRQNTTRVEAEKEALAERVEEEGAERVTLVASITHERDFLLRQASLQLKKAFIPSLGYHSFRPQFPWK